jgi:hypothetical protein
VHQESSSNDVWILGAGPFQRGTIHAGTEFAGKTIRGDESQDENMPKRLPPVDLASESLFTSPHRLAQQPASPPAAEQEAAQALHQEPVPTPETANATPIVTENFTPPPPDTLDSAVQQPPPSSVYSPTTATRLPQPRFDPR